MSWITKDSSVQSRKQKEQTISISTRNGQFGKFDGVAARDFNGLQLPRTAINKSTPDEVCCCLPGYICGADGEANLRFFYDGVNPIQLTETFDGSWNYTADYAEVITSKPITRYSSSPSWTGGGSGEVLMGRRGSIEYLIIRTTTQLSAQTFSHELGLEIFLSTGSRIFSNTATYEVL